MHFPHILSFFPAFRKIVCSQAGKQAGGDNFVDPKFEKLMKTTPVVI